MKTNTIGVLKDIVSRVKSNPALGRELADTADLVGEVGLDSLEMLQFMLEIEAALEIVVDFERLEFSYLRSIHALAAFLDTMPPRPTDGART